MAVSVSLWIKELPIDTDGWANVLHHLRFLDHHPLLPCLSCLTAAKAINLFRGNQLKWIRTDDEEEQSPEAEVYLRFSGGAFYDVHGPLTRQAPVSAERGSLVIVFIIIMLTGMMMMLSAGAPDPDSQGRRHAKGLWIKWDVGCWWWGIKSHVLGGWAIKQSRSLLKNARPLKMDYLIVRDGLRAIILLSRACPVSDD